MSQRGGLHLIKALVFDFDGLILDTETLMYKATKEIFAEYGAELPIEIWANNAGTHNPNFDLIQVLEEQTGHAVDRDAFYKKRDRMALEYIEKADVLPGIRAIIETADQFGLKIGLATSSGDRWAKNHLERLGLAHYFDAFVEANDVKNVKPDPELYLKACEALGVRPNEAIAFEDSYHGAVAAKAAGLYCIVVPNEVTRNLEFEGYDRKFNSLAETSLEELIELFNTGK
jgi:HAD superfamily hydrolase (TIGR01509 family)